MSSHDENTGTEPKPQDVLRTKEVNPAVEWDPVEPEQDVPPSMPHGLPMPPLYTEAPQLDKKFSRSEQVTSPDGVQRPTKEPVFGHRTFSLRELNLLKLERPEEIVDNILYEGETVALVARPKTGKTRLMRFLERISFPRNSRMCSKNAGLAMMRNGISWVLSP